MNIEDANDIEDLESSASSELDASAPAATADVTDAAESSPATGEKDDSLLSVVRDVVDESRKESAASPAEGEEQDKPDPKAPKEPDDVDYTDVPFHKHPRFQHILKRLKTASVGEQRYNNVQSFLDQHGLTAEDAANALQVRALMTTNPVEAWKQLKPLVQQLLVAAGEVLPDDLAQRVQKGEMSREAALDVSRANAAVRSTQVQRSFEEQRRQRDAESQASSAIMGAAAEWEADRNLRDPNFAAKQQAVAKEVIFLQRTEGVPNTPQGVKEQLNKAYKAVNDSFRAPTPAPARRAIRPVTGGQVAGSQKPAVSSTLDIIRANRQTA